MAPQVKDTVQDQIEWEQFKSQIEVMLKGVGTLLFLPLILIASCCVAFRAGIIAGAKEGLRCLERWC
jgi:hypothetical protein